MNRLILFLTFLLCVPLASALIVHGGNINISQTINNYNYNTSGGAPYLYTSVGVMYVNDTALNNTINALDDDTTYTAGGIYVYLDTLVFRLNETKLNATIAALDSGDTTYTAGLPYLFLSGTEFNLNESYLNATIQALSDIDTDTDTWWVINGTYFVNESGILSINTSGIQKRVTGSCAGQVMTAINSDGTVTCETDDTSVGGSGLLNITNTTNQEQLDLSTGELRFLAGKNISSIDVVADGSNVNITINALDTNIDTDTRVAGALPYLYNDSASMYVNETLLNATINALDDDTTYTASGIYVYLDTLVFRLNETKLNATIAALDSGDTTYTAGLPYLFLSGTEFYINESYLNATIEALSDIDTDTDTWWTINESYFVNESNVLSINTSGIQARVVGTCAAGTSIREIAADGTVTCETDDVGGGGYVLNISNSTDKINITDVEELVFLSGNGNCTVGVAGNNVTYTCLDTDTDTDTTYSEDDPYLTLSSEVFGIDESALNTTIQALSIPDDETSAVAPWLYEVGDAVTFNESYGNATYVNEVDEGGLNVNYSTTSGSATTWDGETSQVNLNVNSSGSWDGLDTPSDIAAGDITDDGTFATTGRVDAVNATVVGKASPGSCASGQFVQNTTSGGVQCVAVAGDGQGLTGSNGLYLFDDGTDVSFNDSMLNATIAALDTDTTYSESDPYLTLSSEVFGVDEAALNATILALDTDTNTNCSGDNSCAGILYETELDDIEELNSQIGEVVLISGGTLTTDKWCVYDGVGVNCNVEPVSPGGNSSEEMQDAVLGVGQSSDWITYLYSDTSNLANWTLNLTTGDTRYYTQSTADSIFITQADEANLNVNSSLSCDAANLAFSAFSSDAWDALDDPSDISAGDISDDNTYVTVSGDTMTGTLHTSGNLNITTSNNCLYGGDGGRICFNATCVYMTSPDGGTVMRACN